jgi:hypothetical protein
MALRVKTRWQASGIHLALSALIAVAALAVMLALWYPGPLFKAAGGNELLFILVGVDVIIGPLLTMAVFRAGKPGLRFDLAVIALLQIAALVYGAHIVYLARPAFIVFVKDRFEVVSAVDLEPEELAKARYPQFSAPPASGPMLAYADPPTDPKRAQKMLADAFAGRDLQHFPEFFAPYAERTRGVVEKAMTMQRLRSVEPGYARIVDGYLGREHLEASAFRYTLLRARRAWVVVLIDPKSGYPQHMLITEQI